MIKKFTDHAWNDYLYWQTQDKKTLKRINNLLKDIDRNPYEGIGKPEPLKGNLSGWWSRRINDCDRIIYRIEGDSTKSLVIAALKGHY
ncbi:MAG: Txe/YoeB family addiction module toxin [Lentisphaeraceae bacterium]|nr:Txe/YoeB family addiction module toxin [Lentisphaeraceae bacterium]